MTKPEIWRDYELPAGARLTPAIREKLSESATIVIFLSPNYLVSDWCRREMSEFLAREVEKRDGPGQAVFIVECDEVERPEAVSDILSVKFWERDPKSKRTRLLGFPQPAIDDPNDPYFGSIQDLASDIALELRRQKKARDDERKRPVATPAILPNPALFREKEALAREGQDPASGATIYLAEVGEDLEDRRKEVKRYLEQYGYRLLPRKSLPSDRAGFETAMHADLEESLLFVQLLDEKPGRELDDDEVRRVRLQFDCATKAARSVPVMQWRSRGVDPKLVMNLPHRALLEGAEFVDDDPEGFKEEITRRIKKLLTPERANPKQEKGVERLVYVDADKSDFAIAKSISEILERQGIGVLMPSTSEKPTEVREAREANLTYCDGVLLVNGPTPAWVLQCYKLYLKVKNAREAPVRAMALWDGPPGKKCEAGAAGRCIWFNEGCGAPQDRAPYAHRIQDIGMLINCRSTDANACSPTFQKFLSTVLDG